jgi:hypothetical protein
VMAFPSAAVAVSFGLPFVSPRLVEAILQNGASTFGEVGLYRCPSERKGEGAPVRSLQVPSHVRSHRRPPPKCGAFRLQPRVHR